MLEPGAMIMPASVLLRKYDHDPYVPDEVNYQPIQHARGTKDCSACQGNAKRWWIRLGQQWPQVCSMATFDAQSQQWTPCHRAAELGAHVMPLVKHEDNWLPGFAMAIAPCCRHHNSEANMRIQGHAMMCQTHLIARCDDCDCANNDQLNFRLSRKKRYTRAQTGSVLLNPFEEDEAAALPQIAEEQEEEVAFQASRMRAVDKCRVCAITPACGIDGSSRCAMCYHYKLEMCRVPGCNRLYADANGRLTFQDPRCGQCRDAGFGRKTALSFPTSSSETRLRERTCS